MNFHKTTIMQYKIATHTHAHTLYILWLVGVFDNYMTGVQGQRMFATVGKRFISGKLLMIKDKGCMFVEYTIVAMVHMIYTMETSY